MKSKNKKIINIVLYIIGFSSILFVIFKIISIPIIINNIRNNPAITTGTIVGYKKDPPEIILVYAYTVQGVEYKKTSTFSTQASFDEFKGKKIPVVYQKNKPNRSYLLYTPEHFGMLGQSFPDSLRWLLKYK